jgi:hypothetical protein
VTHANRRKTAHSEEPDVIKRVLSLAAMSEAATGLALLAAPSLVGRWLLGEELTGVALPVAHVLGIALVSLGVACWPGGTTLCGMLTYSVLATGYLAWLGIRGQWVGPLLWPAVAVHAGLTVLLIRMWLRKPNSSEAKPRIDQANQR